MTHLRHICSLCVWISKRLTSFPPERMHIGFSRYFYKLHCHFPNVKEGLLKEEITLSPLQRAHPIIRKQAISIFPSRIHLSWQFVTAVFIVTWDNVGDWDRYEELEGHIHSNGHGNDLFSCVLCQGDLSAKQVSVVWHWALSVNLSTKVFALHNSYHSPPKKYTMCNTSKRPYQKSFVARIAKPKSKK